MRSRVNAIDAGRAVAALVVVWHHVMVFYGAEIGVRLALHPALMRMLSWLSDQNQAAVMFFFFVSGWSICLSLESLERGGQPGLWRSYARHRARRIVPVYWLALAWSGAVVWMIGRTSADQSLATLFGNVVFLQTSSGSGSTWFAPFAGNGPLWSLSYEVWYYAALPVVLRLAAQLHSDKVVQCSLVYCVSLLLAVAAIGLNRFAPNPFLLFASLWPVWWGGFMVARSGPAWRQKLLPIALVCMSALAIHIATVLVRSDTLVALSRGLAVASLACLPVLLMPLFRTTGQLIPTRVQTVTSVLTWLSRGSYSIYLLHYPLLMMLFHFNVPVDAAIPIVVASLCLCAVLEPRIGHAVAVGFSPKAGASTQ